jgi:hypothetical protein
LARLWHRGRYPRLKVDIARDVSLQANASVDFLALPADFARDDIARSVLDCDFLFLAADDMRARLVFNAIVQQYYIPGIQIGARVDPDRSGIGLDTVFGVTRWVLPNQGCLWCSGAIDRQLLASGAKTDEERRDQDYGTGHGNPSVVTLNAVGAAAAANDFLFSFLGLFRDGVIARPRRWHHLDRRVQDEVLNPDPQCPECSLVERSRLGRGDGTRLPTVTR